MTVLGTDGRGEPKLAGETAVCGKWKGALAMRLQQSQYGLHCSTVSDGLLAFQIARRSKRKFRGQQEQSCDFEFT